MSIIPVSPPRCKTGGPRPPSVPANPDGRTRTSPRGDRPDPEFTAEDAAPALAAASDPAGGFVVCPGCGELAAFIDAGELYCLDCSPVTLAD